MHNRKRMDMGKPIITFNNKNKNIVQVPRHLTPMQFSRYPPDNAITFERWFLNQWTNSDSVDRHYLPIQWTALYCNNGYGNAPILHTIQEFLDTLPTDKKYYTIVQYDDGILNNIEHLDIEVCAMAGPRIDFSLPLLCTPHKCNFIYSAKEANSKYRASFIGNLTHTVRANMIQELQDKEGFYISTKHHNLTEYNRIIRLSKYVLCPRGYGANSFRIQEAIDFGAIPIYISDQFIFPYNMPSFPFGICAGIEDNIEDVISYAENTGLDKIIRASIDANKKLYTYAGCKQEILVHLKNKQANDVQLFVPPTE